MMIEGTVALVINNAGMLAGRRSPFTRPD